MLHLIITCDYEIFQTGTGDVMKCVIEPTQKLMEICNKYGAKLTIFFDVCEYLAFQEAEKKGLMNHLDYSPSEEITTQIKYALSLGHDIQLHLHPHWIGAQYKKNSWDLNYNLWRLPALSNQNSESITLDEIFNLGKKTLEDLLKPVVESYSCTAFRAGGYNIQPSKEILSTMKKLGFKSDSSVLPGFVLDKYSKYDFRTAPQDKNYWWVSNTVTRESSEKDILEMPIKTLNLPWSKFGRENVREYFFGKSRTSPCGCYGKTFIDSQIVQSKRSRSLFDKIIARTYIRRMFHTLKLLLKSQKEIFDYCHLSSGKMQYFVDNALANDNHHKVNPLVMTGHSKSFNNTSNFEKFIKRMRYDYFDKDLLEFKTLSASINIIHDNEK